MPLLEKISSLQKEQVGGGGDAYLRGRQGNFDLGKMMVSILHTN